MRGFTIGLGLLALPGLCCAQDTVPPLPTRTLSGQALTIPGDLPRTPSVLVVGFTRASRRQTTAWGQRLADLPAPVFQVAMLEPVPSLFRGFVVGGIRSDVPKGMQDHFLVAAQGTVAWKAVCAGAQEDDACVLLLAPDGHVLWRGGGDATDSSETALRQALARLPKPPP